MVQKPLTGTLAKSEDPDEMLHIAAFHLGLHCLLRQNRSSEKEIQYFLEIITFNRSIYTMDNLIVYSFTENSVGPQRVIV